MVTDAPVLLPCRGLGQVHLPEIDLEGTPYRVLPSKVLQFGRDFDLAGTAHKFVHRALQELRNAQQVERTNTGLIY